MGPERCGSSGVGQVFVGGLPGQGESCQQPFVQRAGRFGEGVERPQPLLAGLDPAGAPEMGQVPRCGGLGDAEDRHQIAHAAGSLGKQAEQPTPQWVGEGFEELLFVGWVHGERRYIRLSEYARRELPLDCLSMAVYFDIAVGTSDKSSAEAVAHHLAGLDFLGAAPHVGQRAHHAAEDAWWVEAWVRGLSINAPGDLEPRLAVFQPEARRRLEAIYERLRSGPPFRCAAVGGEVCDSLLDAEDGTFRQGELLIDDDVLLEVGSIVDGPLCDALGAPTGFEPFRSGMVWRPQLTRTPWAYRMVARRLGGWPVVDRVPASELGWKGTPEGAELDRLTTDEAVLYLHPRAGRWVSLSGPAMQQPVFLGVLGDALVFARKAPSSVHQLFERLRGEPIADLTDGLAGSPSRHGEGLVSWGPFCDRVLDCHVEQLMAAAADGVTYHLHALEAPADGLRQTVIVHAG